jgi:hypothetical protein
MPNSIHQKITVEEELSENDSITEDNSGMGNSNTSAQSGEEEETESPVQYISNAVMALAVPDRLGEVEDMEVISVVASQPKAIMSQ